MKFIDLVKLFYVSVGVMNRLLVVYYLSLTFVQSPKVLSLLHITRTCTGRSLRIC